MRCHEGDTVQERPWESAPEAEWGPGTAEVEANWARTMTTGGFNTFSLLKSLLGLLTISPGERPDLAFLSGYLVTDLLAYKVNNLSKRP